MQDPGRESQPPVKQPERNQSHPASSTRVAAGPKVSEVSFRPLSDGLGFHPFSDGLPYAPLTPSSFTPSSGAAGQSSSTGRESRFMGTGAVAAGPPTIVLPSGVMKVQRGSLPRPLVASTLPVAEEVFHFSYVLKRFAAYTLDLLLVAGLLIGSLLVLVWKQSIEQAVFSNGYFLLAFAGFVWFSHWVLVGAQEVLFKTSLGKAFFGLSLEGSTVRIFARSALFLMSFGCAGMGIFWSLFDSRYRCWHDRLSQLQPTYNPRVVSSKSNHA